MKLCYQVATPDVRIDPQVTAFQGDLESAFRQLRERGYDGAELMVCDPAKVDAEEIERYRREYDLEIPMICTGEIFGQAGLCFSDDGGKRAEAILRAKAAVDLAAKMKAQVNIGRLRGGYMFGKPEKECIERSESAMREVASYAGRRGVILALEPINPIAGNYINTTQEGLEVLREIQEPACKLMLDSNHMFISDRDMMQSIRDAKGLFTYVHIADSNRLYPGNCKLDFKSFISALRDAGYDGWLGVEVFQRPSQEVALKESAAYLREIIG